MLTTGESGKELTNGTIVSPLSRTGKGKRAGGGGELRAVEAEEEAVVVWEKVGL
jgi:hypothetical protein